MSDTIPTLSEADIDAIAERAAKRALQMVYEEVGKSAVRTILWVIGVATLAILAFLGGRGFFKPHV